MNVSVLTLTTVHVNHLSDEGFSAEQIDRLQRMGVRSISKEEAQALGFRVKGVDGQYHSSSGLYFPFTNSFGQIRADEPPVNSKGEICKYLTPLGQTTQALIPDGCRVITEGYKDALAGSLHGGIPTGAIAGISHYRKALQPGSRYVVLFDSDGWSNPAVLLNLFNAGRHLKGKVQILPPIPNEPKAGLCEWFKWLKSEGKDLHAQYKTLVDSAMRPESLLLAWGDRIGQIVNEDRRIEAIRVAFGLAAKHLKELQQEVLLNKIAASTKLNRRTLQKELTKQRQLAASTQTDNRQNQNQQAGSQPQSVTGKPPLGGFNRNGDPVLSPASKVASILTEEYRQTLAYNVEAEAFYRYEAELAGVWTKEPDPFVRAIVQAELDSRGASGMYSAGYITSIVELVKAYLAVRHWDESDGLLPLQNGVLEIATLKLLSHSPGYRFTWQLPYEYRKTATCEPIVRWLSEAQDGDRQRVQLLRAYLKAVVCGRTDLQRFVECLGPGGTGKSTFTRLAIALVGLKNTFITELKQLEANRFETSGIYGKRLVLISDSERYGGTVTVLKALTGQDPLRYEQKHRQQGSGFVSRAMVLIAANESIQSSDYTSGLERRRLTIPFLHQVAPDKRRDLLTITDSGVSGEFVPYLPGLLNWVLAMSDEEMRNLLLDTAISVPSLNQWRAESLLESNPLAEWLDSCVVHVPGVRSYVGTAVKIRFTEGEPGNTVSWDEFRNAHTWLYANYNEFTGRMGNRAVSLKRFVGLLEDLCRSQLRLHIRRGRDVNGSYFEGLAIRTVAHDHIPRPITKMMDDDGTLTAESPGNVGFDGYDGSFDLNRDLEQNYSSHPSATQVCRDDPATSCNNPSDPSNPSATTIPAISVPSEDHAIANGRWRTDGDPFWLNFPIPTDPSARPAIRRSRALQLRNELLGAKQDRDLQSAKARWDVEQVKFVWSHVLTASERNKLLIISNLKQPELFEGGQVSSNQPFAVGDRDWFSPESLADIRGWWKATDSEEIRAEIRRIVPPDVLERAIA